jgi:hypothetical protein
LALPRPTATPFGITAISDLGTPKRIAVTLDAPSLSALNCQSSPFSSIPFLLGPTRIILGP